MKTNIYNYLKNRISKDDVIRLLINNRFECDFLESIKNLAFQNEKKEQNSPAYVVTIRCNIVDKSSNSHTTGELAILRHTDINIVSATLAFLDSNNTVTSLVSAIEISEI